MSTPTWVEQRGDIKQAFVRGTRRVDLPLNDQTTCAKLSLLAAIAARCRFDVPPFPDEFEQDENNTNPEFTASMEIRSSLCRYFRANRKSEQPHSAVLRVFDSYRKRKLYVHRFDYMQLKPLLSIDASLFDVPFRRWASNRNSQERLTSDEMTDENWLEFGVAERCDYIQALHYKSPGQARALLAECIRQETANVRGKLLTAIAGSVTHEDKEFIESFLTDRAKSVQEIVFLMLGGLAGTEQYNKRFEAAAERLSIKKSKILKKITLAIDQPAGYKNYRLDEWYAITFNRLDPVALAAHLDVSTEKFCELIEKKGLAIECINQLARQQNHELMIKLAARHSDAFMAWVVAGDTQSVQSIDNSTKDKLWAALLDNASMQKFEAWVSLVESTYLALRSPVPAQLSQQLIARPEFVQGLQKTVEDHESRHFDIVEILVAVLHADCYSAFIASLEDVSSIYTLQANHLISLLNLLEAEQ